MSLDLLGAGEGLGTKYITVRVKRIDTDRLGRKVGGATAALPLVDQLPEIALRMGMPMVSKLANNDYGVDFEWQVSDVPPGAGKLPGNDGFGLGAGVGIAIGALGVMLLRKIF